MKKTEAQIVSYDIPYLNPSPHQCQPSYKKYIAVQIHLLTDTKWGQNYLGLCFIDHGGSAL